MRLARTSLCLLLLALASSSCTSTKVTTEHAPGISFAAIRTFTWRGTVNPAEAEAPTDDVDVVWFDGQVREAIRHELEAKGLVFVDDDASADVRIGHHFSVDEELRVNDPYYAYSELEVYDEGTLVVDMVDARSRFLIWRGVARRELSSSASVEQRAKNVRKVVAKLFAHYPPE